MRNTWIFLPLTLLTAAPATAQSNPSEGEREAVVRSISMWDAGCDGGERDSWPGMAQSWYNELTSSMFWPIGQGSNAWVADGNYVNGNFVDSNQIDSSLQSFGNDTADDRIDNVDVTMLALHGSIDSGDRYKGSVRVDESGDGNCSTWQGGMLFGNSDCEFVHLSSCNSMSKVSWWPNWSDSFDGVHQIDGFHGLMWIGDSRDDDYAAFAFDSFLIPISVAWVDTLYDPDASNGDAQCPVARGVGLSQDNLWDRMDNERYNWVFSDPDEPDWHGVIFIAGCDPKGQSALPN